MIIKFTKYIWWVKVEFDGMEYPSTEGSVCSFIENNFPNMLECFNKAEKLYCIYSDQIEHINKMKSFVKMLVTE